MRSSTFLIVPVVLCVLAVATGCENKRYQPAKWSSTTMPGKMDQSNKAKSGGATNTLEKPTDWMTMAGKGGENVKRRGTSLPTAANRGSTMPARRSGTSLPARGIGGMSGTSLPARATDGTTLPARQLDYQSGTTMPARKGTTLPRR